MGRLRRKWSFWLLVMVFTPIMFDHDQVITPGEAHGSEAGSTGLFCISNCPACPVICSTPSSTSPPPPPPPVPSPPPPPPVLPPPPPPPPPTPIDQFLPPPPPSTMSFSFTPPAIPTPPFSHLNYPSFPTPPSLPINAPPSDSVAYPYFMYYSSKAAPASLPSHSSYVSILSITLLLLFF